jgi:hypothetical protein
MKNAEGKNKDIYVAFNAALTKVAKQLGGPSESFVRTRASASMRGRSCASGSAPHRRPILPSRETIALNRMGRTLCPEISGTGWAFSFPPR